MTQKCPNCGSDVEPRADGDCPVCTRPVNPKPAPPVKPPEPAPPVATAAPDPAHDQKGGRQGSRAGKRIVFIAIGLGLIYALSILID